MTLMSEFPDKADITGTPTNAIARAWFEALYDAVTGLVGTDGTAATALATLKAPFSAYAAKTTTYAVVEADRGKVIDVTSGTFSVTLLAAATAGAGFQVTIRNSGSGTVTVDPNSSETINGATTLALAQGESVVLVCTGAVWVSASSAAAQTSSSAIKVAAFAKTAGPAYTKDIWNTVPFDTELFDADNIATLSSDTISLPSGTYIVDADVTVHGANSYGSIFMPYPIYLKIANTSDAVDLCFAGTSGGEYDSTGHDFKASLKGVFTLAATKNVQVMCKPIASPTSNTSTSFAITGSSDGYASLVRFMKIS